MIRIRGPWSALVLLLAPGVLAAELRLGGDLGFGYDSNPLNARGEDVQGGGFATFGLRADQPLREGLSSRWDLRGSLQGEAWDEPGGLSHIRGQAQLRWRYRADGGFYTPSLSAWGSAVWLEYDSHLRDGAEVRLGISLQQPVNTAFIARAAAGAFTRDSASPVFDLAGASLALGMDWTPVPRLVVYGAFQWQVGDTVSTSSTVLPYADVGEPEDALRRRSAAKSSHIAGCVGQTCAYRVDAETGIASLGLNLALGRDWALDLQSLYADSRVDRGGRYYRGSGVLSLLGRF